MSRSTSETIARTRLARSRRGAARTSPGLPQIAVAPHPTRLAWILTAALTALLLSAYVVPADDGVRPAEIALALAASAVVAALVLGRIVPRTGEAAAARRGVWLGAVATALTLPAFWLGVAIPPAAAALALGLRSRPRSRWAVALGALALLGNAVMIGLALTNTLPGWPPGDG